MLVGHPVWLPTSESQGVLASFVWTPAAGASEKRMHCPSPWLENSQWNRQTGAQRRLGRLCLIHAQKLLNLITGPQEQKFQVIFDFEGGLEVLFKPFSSLPSPEVLPEGRLWSLCVAG